MQKVALKLILKEKYKDYQNALNALDLQNLRDRREYLCLDFAIKCQKKWQNKTSFSTPWQGTWNEYKNQSTFQSI